MYTQTHNIPYRKINYIKTPKPIHYVPKVNTRLNDIERIQSFRRFEIMRKSSFKIIKNPKTQVKTKTNIDLKIDKNFDDVLLRFDNMFKRSGYLDNRYLF